MTQKLDEKLNLLLKCCKYNVQGVKTKLSDTNLRATTMKPVCMNTSFIVLELAFTFGLIIKAPNKPSTRWPSICQWYQKVPFGNACGIIQIKLRL